MGSSAKRLRAHWRRRWSGAPGGGGPILYGQHLIKNHKGRHKRGKGHDGIFIRHKITLAEVADMRQRVQAALHKRRAPGMRGAAQPPTTLDINS